MALLDAADACCWSDVNWLCSMSVAWNKYSRIISRSPNTHLWMTSLKGNLLLLGHSFSNNISPVIFQWQDTTFISSSWIVATSVSPKKKIFTASYSWRYLSVVSQVCISHQWQQSGTGLELVLVTIMSHPHYTLHTQIWTLVAKPRLFFDTPPNAVETTNRI